MSFALIADEFLLGGKFEIMSEDELAEVVKRWLLRKMLMKAGYCMMG